MKPVINFLFKKPVGQAITIGLLVVLSAYFGRLYYVDMPRLQEYERAKAGPERLESMANSLDETMSNAPDREVFVESLPETTAWYPALACDTTAPFVPQRDAIWNVLGMPTEGKTDFQYRFDRHGTGFVMRARRDVDCDGIYAVHTLRGATDWASVVGTKITSQNSGE